MILYPSDACRNNISVLAGCKCIHDLPGGDDAIMCTVGVDPSKSVAADYALL